MRSLRSWHSRRRSLSARRIRAGIWTAISIGLSGQESRLVGQEGGAHGANEAGHGRWGVVGDKVDWESRYTGVGHRETVDVKTIRYERAIV